MKSSGPSFLPLAVLLIAPACTLPPPLHNAGGGGSGMTEMCLDDSDAGADAGVDSPSGDDGGAGNAVTPVACAGTGPNPNAIDRYSQGYSPSPDVLSRVQSTIAAASLADLATQMRGTPYGTAFSVQYNDIQRSMDTASIRGFRYRDASRGMNLGEDMAGSKPNAGVVDSLLGARHLRHLVGNLAEIAEAYCSRQRVGAGVVAFELSVRGGRLRQRLRLPFMVHRGRLFLFGAAHERGIGRVDAIDHIAEVFAVTDRLVGRDGIGG